MHHCIYCNIEMQQTTEGPPYIFELEDGCRSFPVNHKITFLACPCCGHRIYDSETADKILEAMNFFLDK
jgi:hypothetical protein